MHAHGSLLYGHGKFRGIELAREKWESRGHEVITIMKWNYNLG